MLFISCMHLSQSTSTSRMHLKCECGKSKSLTRASFALLNVWAFTDAGIRVVAYKFLVKVSHSLCNVFKTFRPVSKVFEVRVFPFKSHTPVVD